MIGTLAIRCLHVLVPTLVLLLGLSAVARAEDKIVREFTRELNLEPGRQVVLENPIGEVKITGWDRNVVQIRAMKKCEKEWFNDHRKKAEEALDRINIEISEESAGVRIITQINGLHLKDDDLGLFDTCRLVFGLIRRGLNDNMPVEVSYEIMVPARVDLDVKCDIGETTISNVEGQLSVRGNIGKIQTVDTRGKIFARNDIGEIDVINASGSVDAKTSMGAVYVDIMELGAQDQVQMESGMGEVKLKIPADARVDVTTECGMGSFDNNLGERFEASVHDGDVRGKFNGGGASVCLKSGMGAINIASR